MKIEQLLSKEFDRKFQVIIEASQDETVSAVSVASIEDVEEDELVQVARGLFDGTIIQVKNIAKDEE